MVSVKKNRDIPVFYISMEYNLGGGGGGGAAIGLSSSGVFIWIRFLRSDDGGGYDNVNLSAHHTFSVHFFAVTARLRRARKMPNFTFYAGRKRATSNFFFLCLNMTWMWPLGI